MVQLNKTRPQIQETLAHPLSLYSTPSNPANNFASAPVAQDSFGTWGQALPTQNVAQPTTFGQSSGASLWSSQSGWNQQAPAPATQPNIWGSPAQPSAGSNSLFDAQGIWGNTSSVAGNSLTASGTGTQKKDDAFGDIWGSLK